jgi:hypothetical protein
MIQKFMYQADTTIPNLFSPIATNTKWQCWSQNWTLPSKTTSFHVINNKFNPSLNHLFRFFVSCIWKYSYDSPCHQAGNQKSLFLPFHLTAIYISII